MAKHNFKKPPPRDIYAAITAELIKAIEADPGRPQMPWRKTGRPLWMPENATTGATYNGINVVNLWVAAETRGFTSPQWATYKQWQEIGAQVRKGAKSHMIVYYGEFETEPGAENPDDDGKRRFLRHSNVFNAQEVDGYELPAPPEPLDPIERLEAVEAFIAATGARIEQGGQRAYYRRSADLIQMPDERLFTGTDTMNRQESWYAVQLHELTHWTGHQTRCNRDAAGQFGSPEYAFEELIAETGAAFLCAQLQITQDVRADHSQYLANWLQMLKDDPKAIFKAAARANEAVTFLKKIQSKTRAATPVYAEQTPAPA